MKRICIIPCGAKKIWDVNPEAGSQPADLVYLSPLHQRTKIYAQTFFSDWMILSAKHGFLKAGDMIHENYDVAFGKPHKEQVTREELSHQFDEKNLAVYDELVILGGKKYRKVIDPLLQPHQKANYPLAPYQGIGYMLQALKRATETKIELPPHISYTHISS
ncbi:DUF6884 domain-containing protein [Bacillus altitudinis]|uniref:DUF6884 domain-containing protein n=1 Tax=Bacillus TaxID=1386 RepID=UPI00227DB359|nr:DUF6884 domain-containing protein [Bacillus altitudinis]MCY7533214.1 hypothetical protein [Bacillus altitudinis]WOQ72853.1 hypothetical protein R0126_00295 [Bacillus stratosphericus]